MEDAFERYLRSVLVGSATRYGAIVLDGNKGEPQGARRPLYANCVVSDAERINVTPDILVKRPEARDFLIDVKYKVLKGGLPDREDVNQAITYSAAYGIDDVFLAYPRRSAQEPVVQIVGSIGRTRLGVLRFDLAATKLDEEAETFADNVLGFEAALPQ